MMALPQYEIVFRGHLSKFEQKEGDGEEVYITRKGLEYYTGNFKRDAYNGHANYFANSIKRGMWAYDGNFCSNSIEGFGTLSYGDATYFAGLFKYDKPFGPGVLTYANGKQDVGIWSGSQLYRLCTTVGYIPKLTNSLQDKLLVTKFKKLILVNEYPREIASAILDSFGRNDASYTDPSLLYSRFCKDPKSYFYNYRYFHDDLSDLTEIEHSLRSQKTELPNGHSLATKFVNTKIIEVKTNKDGDEIYEEEAEEDYNYNDDDSRSRNYKFKEKFQEAFVLAWNNTPKVIDIMKHSFRHRNQEDTSVFDIANILCGRRKVFRIRGPKENASIKVLEASSRNDVITILKELKEHTLSVDVMDNKGNAMIHRSAANDALDVMRLLNVLGADIDAVNDEGFSALTHTLTRYIALKYDVHNWSEGFLHKRYTRYEDFEDYEGERWLDECMMSDISIPPSSGSSKKRRHSGSIAGRISKSPTIRTSPLYEYEPPTHYVFEFTPEPRLSHHRKELMGPDARTAKEKRLEVIQNTAFYLLDIGVDLHVSVTPAPVMVLAIFSGNLPIVEKILKNGADANELHNINNGHLTALHIIAHARPLPTYPAMVNLLLRYGADPNLRTSVNYDMAEWEYLLDFIKLPHPTVDGLTPLHIIALRTDATYVTNKEYLEQICCILSWFSDHDQLFLGLSPLGLAISKGNNNIVSTMLNCAKLDVNATFDSFWGNPLFTYLKFHVYKSDHTTMDILRTLILKGVDPLEISQMPHGVGNALNLLALFRERRLRSQIRTVFNGYPQGGNDFYGLKIHDQILMELAKLNLRKYIRGVLVRLHLKFINSLDVERDVYLRQQRRTISKHNQSLYTESEDKPDYGYADICERTKDWMNSIDECKVIMEKTIENMGDIYSPVEAIRLISLLPNMSVRQKPPELKHFRIVKFLEGNCLPDLRTCPITKQSPFNIEGPDDNENEEDEEENLKWIRHFVNLHNYNFHVYPELEKNRSKFRVCYRCLKQSAITQACPLCRLVYFCSMKCNVADSNNSDAYHRCQVVFWNLKKQQFFALKKEVPKTIKKADLRKKQSSSVKRKSKSSLEISLITPDLLMDLRDEWLRQAKFLNDEEEYEERGKKHGRYGRHGKRGSDSKKHRKGSGSRKRGSKTSKSSAAQFKFLAKYGYGAVSHEEDELDISGLIKRDRKLDEIDAKKNFEVAARLLDKQSKILEQKKIEAEKLKEERDNIDLSFLGEIAPQEEFWEMFDKNGEGMEKGEGIEKGEGMEKGEGKGIEKGMGKRKKPHSAEDRFMAFLKILEMELGNLDLEKFLPFIVFVDGVIYFKHYGAKFRENYSFN
ncbi:ankyrin repeat and MYND domain-containing protein 1 [Halyomorpha halys]|uniref:ankyrin repeat and MYND domain-containing protein 1 n=1 Tax=Halyomorpha halys TaxID=286706 RepID=UPI0006D5256A|nr:uncharacterized protein LOC106685450 [Halyomorpha halys]